MIEKQYHEDFQDILLKYRQAGFRDHTTILDFLESRDSFISGNTSRDRLERYYYLKDKTNDKEFWDAVFYKIKERLRLRIIKNIF